MKSYGKLILLISKFGYLNVEAFQQTTFQPQFGVRRHQIGLPKLDRFHVEILDQGNICLSAKKKKSGASGGGGGKKQAPQEKQSVKDARFDAQTRQFMFTILGLSKVLPDKSKTLLKNINLCFYPGAKIGVVGLNGSGKSTLLKIMAGVDQEFDGTARPLPGASIGYLPQEPSLKYETVQECVDAAVKSSRALLNEYNELSVKLADPDLSDDEMNSLMTKLGTMGDDIEAKKFMGIGSYC